jgi:hypothetical protein
MLINSEFPFWVLLFIISLMVAVFYGSLSGVLFTVSAGLFVASFQFPEHEFTLRIASGILFLCSIVTFYRAYIRARWDDYQKQIEREPVSPPTDYLIVLFNKIRTWLKLG